MKYSFYIKCSDLANKADKSDIITRMIYSNSGAIQEIFMGVGHLYLIDIVILGDENHQIHTWIGLAYCNQSDGGDSGIISWHTKDYGGASIQVSGNSILVNATYMYKVVVYTLV